jgi:hypothetical protein
VIDIDPIDIAREIGKCARQEIRSAIATGTKDALNKLRGRLD